MNMNDKPTKCIDPYMKLCQECPWGWVHYPDWCETYEDLFDCVFESGCSLGFDNPQRETEKSKGVEKI